MQSNTSDLIDIEIMQYACTEIEGGRFSMPFDRFMRLFYSVNGMISAFRSIQRNLKYHGALIIIWQYFLIWQRRYLESQLYQLISRNVYLYGHRWVVEQRTNDDARIFHWLKIGGWSCNYTIISTENLDKIRKALVQTLEIWEQPIDLSTFSRILTENNIAVEWS